MCGIIGFFTYKNDNITTSRIIRSIVQRMLFAESMVNMESRGKDASGIAVLWSDGKVGVIKQPVHASLFARDDGGWGEEYTNPDDKRANFKEMMKLWLRNKNGAYIKQVLGHVRAKTQGSEYNPHNNHPIIISDETLGKGGSLGEGKNLLIGVHNGGIKNDTELFKKYDFKRIADVDSEVIFHLINRFRDDFTVDNLKSVFEDLTGAFAVMAFNPNNSSKVACMREERPMDAVFIPELGVLGLVSVKEHLAHAIYAYDRWRVREYYSSITVPTDTGNETVNVSDFPVLSQVWATSTVGSGVFVLDLDTEVNDKTKPEDLIKLKGLFKPATAYGHTTGTGYNNGYYGGAKDHRAASADTRTTSTTAQTQPTLSKPPIPLPPAKPSVPEDVARNNTKAEVEDLTDYTVQEVEEENDNPYIEVEVKIKNDPNSAEEESNDDDDLSDEDALVANCGSSWDDLIKMGLARLYEGDLDAANVLTVHKKKKTGARELLAKYLIDFKSEIDAYTALVSMTEIIFPEGFAVGFAEGYNTATIERDDDIVAGDAEEITQNETLAAVHKKLSDIEAELDIKEEQIKERDSKVNELTRSLVALQCKHEKDSRRLKNQYTMIKYLMFKMGIMDASGNIDQNAFDQVRKEAGVYSCKKAEK